MPIVQTYITYNGEGNKQIVKEKVKFTREQAMKAQRGSRSIAVPFL
jgi:hypothetical protein